MITHTDAQGTPEWLEARRGVITASRFKDCRDKLKTGAPSVKAKLYAMDTARERCGGTAGKVFVNAAMQFGTEQEPLARQAYEVQTGNLVEEAGFICDDDRRFGASVDGLVDDIGMIEVKTIVSSDTLFTALVDGDISAYVDQINGAMWLLDRKWCDLVLWCPDLPTGSMKIIRIYRNEAAIEALEADLLEFERMVSAYAAELQAAIAPELMADEYMPATV
jgi:exodeoxyribonuclease (lambda-induced)